MGMINCPECGKEISDQAEACPNCGYVLKKNKKTILIFVIALIVAVICICFFGYSKYQEKVEADRIKKATCKEYGLDEIM